MMTQDLPCWQETPMPMIATEIAVAVERRMRAGWCVPPIVLLGT